MAQKKKKPTGGKKRTGGRPTREELGLEPTKAVTIRLEETVIQAAKKMYGTVSNAVRTAVGQ